MLLEPLPVVPSVAIFGVGHVGLELARILVRHDLELHLVDSRADQLTADRLACLDDGEAAVHVHHAPVPEVALGAVPRRHARAGADPRPCRGLRALRRGAALPPPRQCRADRLGREVDAASGPGLAVEGHDDATIGRIRSPIGQPRPRRARNPPPSRSAVAADLLRVFADRARPESGRDPLPCPGPRHPRRPVHRWDPAQRRGRRAAGRRRQVRRARRLHHAAGRPPRRGRRRPARPAYSFPASSTPTSTTRRCGSSARSGMPLLEWLERCALPEECHLEDAGVRPGGGRGVRGRAGRGRHHHGPGLRLPLRAGGGRPLRRGGHGSGCGSPPGWS